MPWRRTDDGTVEVLLVYRRRYGDWTFPKGKLEPGETDEHAALREVEEETSLRCEPGAELPSTSYRDQKLRQKTVRYWALNPIEGQAAPTHEVDEVRWVPLAEAERLLSYDRDVGVLRALEPA